MVGSSTKLKTRLPSAWPLSGTSLLRETVPELRKVRCLVGRPCAEWGKPCVKRRLNLSRRQALEFLFR